MADTSTGSDKELDLTWGPSHSEDDSDLTGTQHTFTENTFTGTQGTGTTGSPFFTREKLHSTWNFIEENFGILQCRGGKDSVSEDIEDFLEHGCNTDTAQDTKRSTGTASFKYRSSKMSSTVSTPTGTATSSLTREKDYEWFSPPRLRNLATTLNEQRQADEATQRRDSQIPHKILEEPTYLSDMDTFLSDEFTHMEQGFFNGVYDHICNPLLSAAKRKEKVMCSALDAGGEPNSVSLSFDDTISKLTMEDGQKSVSTGTLNTLERMKDVARGRAVIAAIVQAQSSGDWHETAQEEAEAKAEELSRHGIEQTLSAAKPLQQPPVPQVPQDSQEPQDRPSDNVIIVHFIPDSSETEESDFPFDEDEDEDPYKATGKAHGKPAKPSKSMRKRLLRHFRKKMDKIKKKGFSNKDKSSKAKAAPTLPLTPPRKFREEEVESESVDMSLPGTPRSRDSTTDPCSVTTSTEGSPVVHQQDEESLTDTLVEQIYLQVEAQDEKTLEGSAMSTSDNEMQKTNRASNKSPTVVEEVEVLPKRKEPVYTSYVKTQSHAIVEDVEVLRKESLLDQSTSDLSTLRINTKHRHDPIYDALETVNEEGGEVTEWHPYDDDDDDDDEENEPTQDKYEWFHSDAILPMEVQDIDNDDHQTACSSITPSLLTMTSRLAKEREETEELRIMLQKKDEDLTRLRQLLQMNESKAVIERIDSSSKASPLLQSPVLAT